MIADTPLICFSNGEQLKYCHTFDMPSECKMNVVACLSSEALFTFNEVFCQLMWPSSLSDGCKVLFECDHFAFLLLMLALIDVELTFRNMQKMWLYYTKREGMSSWLFLLLYKNKCFNEINDLPLFCSVVLKFQMGFCQHMQWLQFETTVVCACTDLNSSRIQKIL